MMKKIIICFLFLIYTQAYAITESPLSKTIGQADFLRMLSGLSFVLLLIWLLAWLIKRFNVVHIAPSKGFNTVATLNLGPKEKIILVKIGGRYLLMGASSGSINLIYDFGEQLPEGFVAEEKNSFADLLKLSMRKSST